MSANALVSINKIAEALLSFYGDLEDKQRLLDQSESISDFLEKEAEIKDFLIEFGFHKEYKKEVIDIMCQKLACDELLVNTLHLLVDKNLIFYISIFLSTMRTTLNRFLNIQNIYVYSSFPIVGEQKKRLEDLWSKKVYRKCVFNYLIDKSLGLGLKIQVDTYIEEFSLSSQLAKLKHEIDLAFN
ncbi:ATP synthase F1, delta subunit [Mycoplasma haemocanis str. Illinois]|uniref:ATP synthase subunit delta n=1 Tax=Mycoplasma haemocanis (strain Illinois) TaxID=1111676 RepID=H6N5N1_MYCHN|nr:F0F1 ATP synthase subunit delta [Mycoplasma haemocanis]AEW44991.1 ATP synthase F1, delta subunit [Mycoplasma haemocanis str. Illinois]